MVLVLIPDKSDVELSFKPKSTSFLACSIACSFDVALIFFLENGHRYFELIETLGILNARKTETLM